MGLCLVVVLGFYLPSPLVVDGPEVGGFGRETCGCAWDLSIPLSGGLLFNPNPPHPPSPLLPQGEKGELRGRFG
jgi:hypothetical protein